MKVLLGILIGVSIARIIRRARERRGFGHGGHFGPFGRWGGHCGGWRFGGGRGRRMWWLLRELDLDPRQMDELQELWLSIRRTVGEAQFGRWRSMSELADIATADPLDRAKLDELATRHGDGHAKIARDVAAAVAKAHDILRPEQRAKVREAIERSGLWRFSRGGGPPPTEGPYR